MSHQSVDARQKPGKLTRRKVLGLAAAGALVACSPSGGIGLNLPSFPKKGGKLTVAMEQDPVNLAPFGSLPRLNYTAKELIYDSPLVWDKDLKVQPALAQSYEPQGTNAYIFKLRQGVKFHNGAEMTADDVKYSIESQKAPPPPGTPFTYPKINNVDVIDKYTVRLNLTGIDPSLVGYFAWARYSPVTPKDIYTKINVLKEGIGTGPFKLVEFVPNDKVEYVRNPDFWGSAPNLDAVTYKVMTDEQARVAALRAGAVDVATLSADSALTLTSDPNLQIYKGLFASHREIQLTIKTGERKPWHDVRVRQAVSAAIDRKAMVDKVYAGDAAWSSVMAPGYGEYVLPDSELKNLLKLDVDKARKLMADAGFADGFRVTMPAIASPRDFVQLGEIVRENLKAIKVDLTLVPQEIGPFAAANAAGEFDWHLTGRGMRGDPDGFVGEFNPKAAIFAKWFTAWQIPAELPKLLNDGVNTFDQGQRKDIYQRAQRILLSELVHIPLVQPIKYQVTRKRVKGWYVSYTDLNPALREAWIDE